MGEKGFVSLALLFTLMLGEATEWVERLADCRLWELLRFHARHCRFFPVPFASDVSRESAPRALTPSTTRMLPEQSPIVTGRRIVRERGRSATGPKPIRLP